MQRSSGSAICSLRIQSCSNTNGVWVDLSNAIESTIDLVDPCDICLRCCQRCAKSIKMFLAYVNEINASEFASLKPGLELFQSDLYQCWEPTKR